MAYHSARIDPLNLRTHVGLTASTQRKRQTAAGRGGEKWTGRRTHLGLHRARQGKHLLRALSHLTRLPKLPHCPRPGGEALSPFFLFFLFLPLPLLLLETENGLPFLQLLRQTTCPGRQASKATVLPGQVSATFRGQTSGLRPFGATARPPPPRSS